VVKPHRCLLAIAIATSQRGEVEASTEVAWTVEEPAVAQSSLSAFGNLVFFLVVRWNVILHIAPGYMHIQNSKNA